MLSNSAEPRGGFTLQKCHQASASEQGRGTYRNNQPLTAPGSDAPALGIFSSLGRRVASLTAREEGDRGHTEQNSHAAGDEPHAAGGGLPAWGSAEQHGGGDLVYFGRGSVAGGEPTGIIQPLRRSLRHRTWGIHYSSNSRSSSGKALSILIKNVLVMGNPCLPPDKSSPWLFPSPLNMRHLYPLWEHGARAKGRRASPGREDLGGHAGSQGCGSFSITPRGLCRKDRVNRITRGAVGTRAAQQLLKQWPPAPVCAPTELGWTWAGASAGWETGRPTSPGLDGAQAWCNPGAHVGKVFSHRY